MLAVKGIYDGKAFRLLEKLPYKKKYKVIITFIEEIKDTKDADLRNFSSQTEALSFWNEEGENIYQDYISKTKK